MRTCGWNAKASIKKVVSHYAGFDEEEREKEGWNAITRSLIERRACTEHQALASRMQFNVCLAVASSRRRAPYDYDVTMKLFIESEITKGKKMSKKYS